MFASCIRPVSLPSKRPIITASCYARLRTRVNRDFRGIGPMTFGTGGGRAAIATVGERHQRRFPVHDAERHQPRYWHWEPRYDRKPAVGTTKPKKRSFKEAARRILSSHGEPLSAKQITARALADGLIETEGKTPEATMAAQLYVDIDKNPRSLFRKAGTGLFALRTQTESATAPEFIVERQNDLVKVRLKQRLTDMDAFEFEYLVKLLLQRLGYENVEVTRQSGDKGIDVVADLTLQGITNVKTVVQVKRYAEGNKISGAIVTQLRGSAEVDQRGLIITTSSFTKDAVAEASAPNKMPVSLVNGDKLVSLMVQYRIGVKTESLTLHSIDDDFFDEFEGSDKPARRNDKNLTLWPLPGGASAYIDTLLRFLAELAKGPRSKATLMTWYSERFEAVNSEKTIQGYLNVPRSMRLIQVTGGQYELTREGRQFLESGDQELLFRIIDENIAGVSEIMGLLESSAGPVPAEALLEFLRSEIGVDWQTLAQVHFRLYWLQSLGKVEKVVEGWQAV